MRKIIIIVTLLSVFLFCGCAKQKVKSYRIKLEIWGAFDDSSAYTQIFGNYKEMNPNVAEIKYRKMNVDTYKNDILSAMAAGTGPDIFFIPSTWLPFFQDKIVPAPEWLTNEQEFRHNFVDVTVNDLVDQGRIFGAPLSVDSLALYYNRDLLNAEGITSPPTTWEKLMEDSKRLTKIDDFGNINQQGIALGTAYNVNRSADVLSLLTFQFGSDIAKKGKRVDFSSNKAGEKALDFYTQFARFDSPVYTWNPRMHYSIDSFSEGKTAMMINYSWQYKVIKSKNEKLNFAVAKLPQMKEDQPVNHANYWVMVVAKNKPVQQTDKKNRPISNELRIFESWQLIKFMTFQNGGKSSFINGVELMDCFSKKEKNCVKKHSREVLIKTDPATDYVSKTGRPAARRDIIDGQLEDPILGPFAYGNLISKSWSRPDDEAAEEYLLEAINAVNNGMSTSAQAINLAESRINQLIRK